MYVMQHMLPGLGKYYATSAQPLATVGEELDYLDHYLSYGSCGTFQLYSNCNEFVQIQKRML